MPLVSNQDSLRVIYKTADETRTSTTTVSDDSELTIQLDAFGCYKLLGILFYTAQDVAGGFRFKFNSLTDIVIGKKISPVFTGITDLDFEQAIGNDGQTAVAIRGTVQMGASSDDLTLQWAQETSSATATILQMGSFIQVDEI